MANYYKTVSINEQGGDCIALSKIGQSLNNALEKYQALIHNNTLEAAEPVWCHYSWRGRNN